jgi:hypothetical protein
MGDKYSNKDKYECVWLPISKINSNEVSKFVKCDMHFRKSFDICFLIGELDFITTENVDSDIIIDIPELNDKFYKCENTVLIIKNGSTRVTVQVLLEPGKITLEGLFPFEPSKKYELNLQFFMRTI